MGPPGAGDRELGCIRMGLALFCPIFPCFLLLSSFSLSSAFCFFSFSFLLLSSFFLLPSFFPTHPKPSHPIAIQSHPIAIQSFEMDRARLQAIAAHFQKKGCCRNSHPGWLETGLAPPPHSLHDGSGPVAKRAPAARRARGAGEAGRPSSEK